MLESLSPAKTAKRGGVGGTYGHVECCKLNVTEDVKTVKKKAWKERGKVKGNPSQVNPDGGRARSR
jgi:hypothetical protein